MLESAVFRIFRLGTTAVVAVVFGVMAGCASPQRSLEVWKESARFEHVSRYSFGQEAPGEQWFARLVDPKGMPVGCTFPLSDRFDFVVMSQSQQWAQFLRASEIVEGEVAPDFADGVVIGLIAHVGQLRSDRWPILVSSVRQRGRVAFIYSEFFEGFYRPLSVPPYVHLVFVPGVDSFLGIKLNQLLFGFNVDIAELNAAGIK